MNEDTIISSSHVGQRLDRIVKNDQISFLMMDKKRIPLVSRITIGRSAENDIVVDGMLASREHAFIQKIKDEFFIRDLNSTNGTLVNNVPIPQDKYVKLNLKDTIQIGKIKLVLA